MDDSTIKELLPLYADGVLSSEDRRRVEAAVAADPELARFLREYRVLSGLLDDKAPLSVSQAFVGRVAERSRADDAHRRRRLRAGLVAAAALVGVLFSIGSWTFDGPGSSSDGLPPTIWDLGDALEPEPLVSAAPQLDRAWREIRWIEESWGL
jgi:anti-sigma factor RsiW